MSSGRTIAELQDADLLQCAVCNCTFQDAVLLKCLHSICRSCACHKTVHVICPVCRVPTDTSKAKANLILSALAQRSQVMERMFSCTHCAAESEHGASSAAWCNTCQQSLCVECEKHHSKFNPNHKVNQLDEHSVLSEVYRPPSRLCTKHGELLKLACFTCQDGRCFYCAHECYTASHDVQLIDSPDAVNRLKDRIRDTDRVLLDLSSTELLLQAHFSLPEKVASALEESRAVLRDAKKKAIDSISKAYDKAEQSLFECWEVLASKAEALCESAKSLKKRLDWANKYCQVALHTADMTSLLPQLDTLSSCLCSLLDEARKVKQPADPLTLVSMNVCLPHDLDLITSDWFDTVTLISDNFDCSLNHTPNEVKSDYYTRRVAALCELEELIRKQKMQQENFEGDRLATVDHKELQLKAEEKQQHQQQAALMKPLSFDKMPRGTFKGPGRSFDVSITPQGSLLVAALADGLKEYDGTSFREIATWKPGSDLLGQKKTFFVTSVDVLSDGRAVVSLFSKLVVLLRRDVVSGSGNLSGAETWRVERRVAELQAPPRRLAAWGDHLLAVLEDRYNESTKLWCRGPGLVLLSLCDDGKQLHRLQLDYNANSVVLTDRGVVVTSDDQVELTDAVGSGGGSIKCYVVECYSILGLRLWRHEVGGGLKVMSVCSDSVGRVLYAAKPGSVIALRADDGHELSTAITLSTKEVEHPYAIALDRATQRLLALISYGGNDQPNIITIFSVRE